MEDDIKLFEEDSNGRLTVSEEAASRLQQISSEIAALSNEETFIRHHILDGMIANNIERCSSCGLTFTQVNPKPKGEFDVDSFLMNESEELVKCFTTFEETKTFDEEAFKADNPELYEKYVKTDIIPTVDIKKMEKVLEPTFKKYWHETPSTKPVTLRISSKKGE